MANGKFVSYLRVSTDRQGRSGLGLEAQRRAVADYLNGDGRQLLREYVEVESGRRIDRPQLAAALTHAQVTGATVFAAEKRRLHLVIRTIGQARATAKITLANLSYNFTRLAWCHRSCDSPAS